MPPDEYRSEGTPSPGEGPYVRGETFGSFGAFAKGTRRKGETISRRYRSNGYVLNQNYKPRRNCFGVIPNCLRNARMKLLGCRYPNRSAIRSIG